MRKILIVTLFFACVFSLTVSAADPNPMKTQVYSLSITPDAVSGGMGEVGAATAPDVYSQYWNPSKYAFIDSKAGFSMCYTPWLSSLVSDIDLATASGYYKLGENQSLSASLRYFSLGEVIVRQQLEDAGYSENPYEMTLDVAYSRKLSRNFSASVAMRYIHSDLIGGEDPAGNAFAADISAYYTRDAYFGREKGSISFGANISNIGTKISYDGGNRNYFLPANLKIGSSVLYPFDRYNSLRVSVDLNKLLVPTPKDSNDYGEDVSTIGAIFSSFSDAPGGMKEELEEIYGSIGFEYAYNNQFFLRAGYFYENEKKGNRKYYTFGAGFKMSMFSLDASYLVAQSQSNPLDNTLRFSLGFDMEGIRMLMGRR